MTARTAITPVVLTRDGAVREDNAGVAVNQATGMYIAATLGPGGNNSVPAHKLLLLVSNTASSAYNVILRATGSGTNSAGNAWPVTAPSNTVFAQSTLGDLVQSVGASQAELLGPFTSDRFLQSDGTVCIDFGAGFTGTITAFVLPVNWV
jgi:hypothetical protein